MESIEVSSENLGSLKRKLTITVPQNEVQKAYKKSYNSLKNKVSIPGFRKGKYPQSLVEKRFGEQMKHEALERLVPQYFELAIQQEKVEPVVRPQFGDLEIDKKQPFIFSATFEIKPEFDIPEYKSFKVEAEEIEISDEEVEKQKSVHLERAATYVEKADGAAEEGDQLIIDFKPVEENAQIPPAADHKYILGSKQLLPEFEEVLPGMKVGEEKNFSISYPEDYFTKELRGVSAEMSVKLTKLEGRVLPELNDEFFSRYDEKVKTEDDFITMIKDEIKSMKENELRAKRQGELRKQLAEKLSFDVPEQILNEEIGMRVQEKKRRAKDGEGEEKSDEDLKKEVEQESVDQLRFSFFVEKMIQDNEIKVDPSEINRRFQLNCQLLGIDPQMFIQQEYGRHFYQQTQGIVAEETVLNYLTDKVLEQ